MKQKNFKQTEEYKKSKKVVSRLTEIADILLENGVTNAYELTDEAIALRDVQWEYKDGEGIIQGPYTTTQIMDWKKQGFFIGSYAVLMRLRDQQATSSSSTTIPENDIEGNKKRSREPECSIADLDDDDGDEDGDDEPASRKRKIGSSEIRVTNNKPSISAAKTKVLSRFRDWLSSDDIDFGSSIEKEKGDIEELLSSDSEDSGEDETKANESEDDD